MQDHEKTPRELREDRQTAVATIRHRPFEGGEYRVRSVDPRTGEVCTYFTDDIEDAEGTAKAILERFGCKYLRFTGRRDRRNWIGTIV